MPSTSKHVVAPLNLSTTVEGSLVGLRESLVTLSAALESQGRRLELAFTTEGLRVNEEVGSLKAIVQGLRMQVGFGYFPCDVYAPPRTGICYSGGTPFIYPGAPFLVGLPYNLQGIIPGRRFLRTRLCESLHFSHDLNSSR